MAIHYNTDTQQFEFYALQHYAYTDVDTSEYNTIIQYMNANPIRLKVPK